MIDDKIISKLITTSERLISQAKSLAYERYLYETIRQVHKGYYVGFYGMRGIGKTTLLLQLAEKEKNRIYFSADSSHLRAYDLYEVLDSLRKKGYENIFVDEIQSKSNWEQDLKTVYDEGGTRVIFTGSSAIDVKKGADLSRRVLLFEMAPLTFAEYLKIKRKVNAPFISFKQLTSKNAQNIARKHASLIDYLPEYLKEGGVAYPGSGVDIFMAMRRAIDRAITHDLAVMKDVDIGYQNLAYKFLYLVATSDPLEINYSSIANHLEVSKATAKLLVYYMEKTGLVYSLMPCLQGSALVRKEPKILLPIPLREYLNWELVKEANKGALREDFFVQHARPSCYFKGKRGEKTPDYKLRGRSFEVGGKSKSKYQKPDFLVVDGFPTEPNKIPLFLIGLLNPAEHAIRSLS